MERTPVFLTTALCMLLLNVNTFAGDNLLRNTSFEDQGSGAYTAEYWEWGQPDEYGGTWGNVGRESWRTHSGSYIATVRGYSGDNYGGWWQRANGVLPGDTVEASGWFWADCNVNNNWTASEQLMKLEFYASDGTLLSEASTNLSDVASSTDGIGSTNFIEKTLRMTAPENTAWAQFAVVVSGAGNSGALQFDDVSISVPAGRIQNFDGWGSASADGCHEFDDWVLCEGKAVSNANRYVIFSKYVQATNVDNALELYNDTDFDIDLGAESFVIQIYTNGTSSNPRSIALDGTLSAKATLVIANSEAWGASSNLTEYADIENGSMRYMDGNDAVVLRKGGASGTVIDSIGQVGNNPGSGGWGVSTNSTLKHTLVRKTSVTSGRTNAWSAFTPIYEWDAYPDQTYSNLGSYVVSGEGYRPTDISVSIAADLTNYLSTPYFEDGLGSFNFWYARDGSGEALSYDIQVSADNTNWITVDSMTNIVSTNYLFHSFFYYSTTNYYYRLNHVGGNGRLWVDYVEIKEPTAIQRDQYFDDWPDSATNYGCHSHMDWVLCTGKITNIDAYSGSAAQTAPSPGNQIRSPLFTNGCGEVTFVYRRASGEGDPISFALQTSSNGTDWITQTTVSNITATSYQEFYHYLYITDPVYVRIYHQTGASSLLTDDISIGNPTVYRRQNFNQWPTENSYDIHQFQGWTVYTGLVNNTRAYDGQAARLRDTVYVHSYIQSPYLPDGVGSIEFKYAWWGTGTRPEYEVQKSIDGTNWNTIAIVNITNDYNNYMTFYTFQYDPTSHYVRIYHTNGAGRALFDDIHIDTPKPGASVMLEGWHVPEIVRETNSVTLAADIIPRYRADVTNVMAYYRIGGSGPFSNLALIETNLYSYTTTSSIPAQTAGTVVEYYFECYFSGPGAELSSPTYSPEGGSSSPTNFTVTSAQYDNDHLWINEMNAKTFYWDGISMDWQDDTNEFIELVVANTNSTFSLAGCKIELYYGSGSNAGSQYATYTLTNIVNCINGFGFFTLGDPQITNTVDMLFTNAASLDPLDNLSDGYPDGIRLLDPFGNTIQKLCYGGTMPGYEKVPIVKGSFDPAEWSFGLTGTGAVKRAFSWGMTNMTPGAVNLDQELFSDSPPPEFYVLSVHMTTNVVIEHTWESGWNYTPWYATNLPTGQQNWLQVTPFYDDQDGTTNTIWFDFPAGNDCQYFRVRASD